MEKKKRNLIEEIKLVKSRSEFNSRYDISTRLIDIEAALKEFVEYNGSLNNELLKYIPISTVACFEAFFRSVIKEIVDFGKPYSDRVAIYNQSKNVKLDFEVVAAIQTKTLTVGEFVAHILPFNNLDDINSNISILIEKDFLTELKNFHKKSIYNDNGTPNNQFQERSDEIINNIKKTFELRHIFCHEFATNIQVVQQEVLNNYNDCKIFLEHSNNFIWELLYPNYPETQTDINIKAAEEFNQAEEELNTLVDLIKNINSIADYSIETFDENFFNDSVIKWKEYRELRAESVANCVKGGTMYSGLLGNVMTSITKEKIRSLENEFEVMLRRYRSKR